MIPTPELTPHPLAVYWQYLQQHCPPLDDALPSGWVRATESLSWNEPTSAIELNNMAVMALIEAEQQTADLRSVYLEIAVSALQQGVALDTHPLCVAHLALVEVMAGDAQAGADLAFTAWMKLLQPGSAMGELLPLGLIYPPQGESRAIARQAEIQQLLHASNGYEQALWLLTMILYQAKRFFYHHSWTRFLHLAAHITPQFFAPNLKLGLACCMAGRVEGLYYLHHAQQLIPDAAFAMQALYLAYRGIGEAAMAMWQHQGKTYAQAQPDGLDWAWATLSPDSCFTYIPFEQGQLAVSPTLNSAITTVLLGESDWVEAELQFWRRQLQPGMVAIDVGANVGIYTVAAARRVGATGRVLAVEPTPECVECLQETCRLNALDWVSIHAVAASDRPGTVQFSVGKASEFNRVLESSAEAANPTQTIPCVTLDHLIEQEKLSRVDWLKIDAEGHELQVLKGCDRLLTEFAPAILYENMDASNISNTEVAEFLRSRNYQLFRYQPYLERLVPIQPTDSTQTVLNIIALPSRVANFL